MYAVLTRLQRFANGYLGSPAVWSDCSFSLVQNNKNLVSVATCSKIKTPGPLEDNTTTGCYCLNVQSFFCSSRGSFPKIVLSFEKHECLLVKTLNKL